MGTVFTDFAYTAPRLAIGGRVYNKSVDTVLVIARGAHLYLLTILECIMKDELFTYLSESERGFLQNVLEH